MTLSIQSQIHAIFNGQSVIHTTTTTTGITMDERVSLLNGSYFMVSGLSKEKCGICLHKITTYDIVAAVVATIKNSLICYACLNECKKSFLLERFFLLGEVNKKEIAIKDIEYLIFSSLHSLMPQERFSIPFPPFKHGGDGDDYIYEYIDHIHLIYHDLTHLQMQIPHITTSFAKGVMYQWGCKKRVIHDIKMAIFHTDKDDEGDEYELIEIRDHTISQYHGKISLFDALSIVKKLVNG